MKKETAIVALVVVAVGSFLLGRFTAGKNEVVAGGPETATAFKAGEGLMRAGAPGAGVGAPGQGGDIYRVPVGASPWKGAEHAKVTIVEFSDFQCPFCSRVGPTMQRILSEFSGQVKIAFKHNPLSFHQNAQGAAEAAMAAAEQGKFWEYHDKLFANQAALQRSDLERYAQDLGLDLNRFKQALDSGKFKLAVSADQRLAQQIGADGTPSFFVNGRLLAGAMPFDSFKTLIQSEISRADAALARGVPLAGLYDDLTRNGLVARRAAPPPAGPRPDDSKQVYRIPLGASAAKGPATAKVTVVEFSDFQCPFCSRVGPTIEQLMKDYAGQVRVVFKHNPLPFHKDAPLASEAALAAGDQGKFWEMHDKLFANQRALSRADLERYATELGLDMNAFKASLDGNKHKGQIDADMRVAQQFGAMGTPNFFINGRKLVGAQPVQQFKAIIDDEMKKADAALARGVRPEMLYADLTKGGLDRAAPQGPQGPPPDDSKTVYKVPVGKDDSCKGAKDALVTLVEFSEFQCPFCGRVLPTMQEVLKNYEGKVRVCFKHSPLPFHKDAVPASIAALEAKQQGKFWEMHDKLFANQRALSRADLEKYAGEAGLNVDAVKAALDGNKYKSVIDEHQKLGSELGARGTPTFFINGRKLVGAQPFPSFKNIIDEEVQKAEALVKKGVARSKIYEELTKNGLAKAAAPAAAPGRPAEDSKTVYKVAIAPHTPCKGPKNAQVTIAEFSDFQCPFCSRVGPTLKQIEDSYAGKVRVCFVHNPLPFHKDAPGAAVASMAAHSQGKFWEYHDKLFANQRALGAEDLEKYAVEVGLDMSKFKEEVAAKKGESATKADQDLANKIGARGTPTFFINGRKVVGAQPFPSFKAVIDEEIQKTDALLKKGVRRSRLYQTLIEKGVESAALAPAPAPGPGAPPADDNTVYQVALGDAPVKGPSDAPVTIVAFSDFQCPFCSRVNPTLRQVEREFAGKVKIAWKHYPLPFHQDAQLAHQAALAAHEQGKFWEYHDKLFSNQQALKRENLEQYAQDLGLDMEKFKSALDSGKFKSKIDADMADASKAGVRGTPSFLINGKKLVGAQPYERFKEKVQAALTMR
jgi:protein-disulfide isomerase